MRGELSKIRLWNILPHIIRQMPAEYFINQIQRPEYIVNEQQNERMIVIPTDHEGINPQDEIKYTPVSSFHGIRC